MESLIFKIKDNCTLNLNDFIDKDISGLDLTNAVLPKDKELFQKIRNKDLSNVDLPWIDMNQYDFTGVNLTGCTFTEDTIFSSDIDFFQKVRRKALYFVTLPVHDYSLYNFKGVSLMYVKFREGSVLENKLSFLIELSAMKGVEFPDNFKNNAHIYMFNNFLYENFREYNFITAEQQHVLRHLI